ncbi:unnamed protein product [marine sediment metagenome]|uniref:Uncharacterized protein n=1 Tax=marine sediment metagenome TaxID=412755 RepID=X1C9J0_9ZZZZ
MEKHERFRMLAAIILLLSANIRTFQVYLAGFRWNDFVKQISWLPYTIFGYRLLQVYIIVSYGILGFFLLFLKENKLLTFFCIITSFIKGTLGFLRLMNALIIYFSMDWFRISIFLADIIIVASCVHYYIKFTKMDNKGRINFIYINIVFVILIISIIILNLYERLIL